MTDEQKVAYINAQVVCAQAEIAGMVAENQDRLSNDQGIAYGEDAFADIASKYGIQHNQVLEMFNG